MYRYYKYYSYMTEAERLLKKKELEDAKALRQAGNPPYGQGKGQGPPMPVPPGTPGQPKVSRPYKYRGQLVSQVTLGKLRKEPNILASLLQSIFDFFKNITNPPTPIKNVMEKYPAPPYTTGTVAPRITTS